jgi:hypothetical protein
MNRYSRVWLLSSCAVTFVLGMIAGKKASLHLATRDANGPSGPVALSMQQQVRDRDLISRDGALKSTTEQAIETEVGSKRWLLLASAAEKASPEDLEALIRRVGNDSAIVSMLCAHWASVDPKHMFASLCADFFMPDGASGALANRWALVDGLFEHWMKADATAAIKAVTEAPNFPGRESLRHSVANRLMKFDVERGLQVLKEWNVRNYIPDMSGVPAWAARDPQHAAETVIRLGNDYVALEALKAVGKTWAQRDPEAGLRFAAALEPVSRSAFAIEAMQVWAGKDIPTAAAFTANQSDISFRATLAQGLMKAWAATDPAAALAWSQKNLQGAARTEAIGNLIQAAAERSLTVASQLVADMEPGAAQNRACASIFETWFARKQEERPAALEWLASLPTAEAQRAALERVQWNWMWREPDAVVEFVSGKYGSLATASLIQQVARRQANKNPEAAMSWASQLPAERSADARIAVLETWLSVRPAGASEYVRSLPPGTERTRAVELVSQNLIWQSPERAAEWCRTLPVEEQKAVRDLIARTGLSTDQQSRFEKALK